MTLTLTANITATDRSLGVTGTVPDSIEQGYRFRIDDELLEVSGFAYHNVQYAVYRQDDPDRNTWLVKRALDGVAASHTAGAPILGATDAYVASETDTTAPEPFASGGPGGGGALQLLGPFHVTFETANLINPNDHGALITAIDAGSLVKVTMMSTEAWTGSVPNDACELHLATGPSADYAMLASYDIGNADPTVPEAWLAEDSILKGEGNGFASTLRNSMPRWVRAVSAVNIYAGIWLEGTLTAGAADIYVTVMTPG